MRDLKNYAPSEWASALPLRDALRQARNDLWLAIHRRRSVSGLESFLTRHADLAGRDIAVVVAFEEPWILGWLLRMARKNLTGMTVLVCDNSRTQDKRDAIARVCAAFAAPYLALPHYPTRHANRSHGMAMSWIHRNVIAALRPRSFGFIDHDMIPCATPDIAGQLARQPVYGLRNAGRGGCWSLWAGYCFFDNAYAQSQPLNFLYDFSRGLDTGGRNWPRLYAHLDADKLHFAADEKVLINLPPLPTTAIQRVDGVWLHIGGVSYNDRGLAKRAVCERLFVALDESGQCLNDFMTEPQTQTLPAPPASS